MPTLSEQDYLKLKSLVDSPDSGISDAVRERALAAIGSYQEQYETGMRGGLSTEQSMAMGPPENDLVSRLNPALPIVPQALAVQPATTHPGGDEAAQSEWMAGAPNGAISVVHEPPLEVAKKELLANPQLGMTLYPNLNQAFTAEDIAGLTKDNPIYEAYADYKWRQYAEQAAKDGKTAYRYSKADWLHDGKAMPTLYKLAGFAEVGPRALVMGLDDALMFGASASIEKAVDPESAEKTQTAAEESPGLGALGFGLGALSGWGPANSLWDFVRSGGQRAAARAGSGVGGLAARTAAGAGAASVASAAEEAIKGLVAGEGLSGAGERAGDAILSPFAPLLGGAGELLGSAAHRVGEYTRHRGYFGGAPGRLEAQGVEFKFGGPTTPEGAAEAVKEGRRLDVAPQDVRAKELAPKLEAGAGEIRAERAKAIGEQNEQFYGSREGQLRLPATNVVQTVTDKLRSQYQRDGRRMQPIAGAGDKLRRFRGIFNENIGAVSLEPIEGAIELDLEEAGRFLSARWKQKLLPDTPPPNGGGSRNVELISYGDTPDLARREQATMDVRAEDIEDVGVAGPGGTEVQTSDTPPASEMPSPPGRATPTRATPNRNEAIREYGEAMAPGREARSAEAKRMESLAAEQGVDKPLQPWKPDTDKAYLSDLYDQAKGKFGSREEFNQAVLDAHKKTQGGILKRIDLTGAADKGKLNASRIKTGNAEFDLISIDAAKKLLSEWGLPAAGVAGAAALGDEEDAGTAAAAAGFASSLRKKGAGKVYVVPRRSNARDHETLIHNYDPEIKARGPDGSEVTYLDRDMNDIRDAAYRDREARPMNGVPGGWSELKRRARESLDEAEAIQKRVGRGDKSFQQVVDHATLHPGQLLNKEALEAAAQRSGVREQLDAVRALDPWRQINNSIEFGQGRADQRGLMARARDAAYLRAGYPAVRRAENPAGMMRGGRLGRFSLLRGNSLAIEEEEQ